ncbi:clathrin-coated vesicle protein [Coprinopsis cinerea okayama7|uniref:Clathrin-coated vesicle protein n=1 Tax=Coprinopsis cinerea (strain Okayama-7 / 130 / ATCC MYA-4618 / FGSC 9003) TaxID=240176 RepID=A8NA90_COPC7|nr:clathrin-coated vesicle protein [Coprinopsis cinerea okayama7\|eukprot:XP_001831742.2 clathrin-coated vesicle protein [Coprinopsis cinerea okayama7\
MTSDSKIESIVESEVTGENGEIYLLQWLCSTEKALLDIPIADLKPAQSEVESTLLKVISGTEGYPSPGRVIRRVVGRCFVALYSRGETRTMFDTLQALMKLVGDVKSDKETVKIAAWSCVGDIMAAFGSNLMSFMAEIALVSLKTAKSSSSPLLRYQALIAFQKALTTAKRAVQESTLKDALKQMRYALTDKSLPVQRAACQVIVTIYSEPDALHPTASDIESILSTSVKNLENIDQTTRQSHAHLIGHLLSLTQVERPVAVPETNPKAKKDQESLADEPGAAAHVVAETLKAMMPPQEMLILLSNHLNRNHLSRKIRVGIFEFYVALLNKLGPNFVESNFSLIVAHLLNEVVLYPRNTLNRYEALLTRKLVAILLRDLIGVRMLSEQGQITAIRELATSYLKRWPAMMPGQVAPSPVALVIVLREVAGLLQQLGNAPPPVQDALAEPLVTLLSHPNHTVRVNAAWALRCFCYSTPLRLPKAILVVVDKLQKDLATLVTPVASADVPARALGHAYGLAALVSIIPQRPLYVSYDVTAKILDIATQILKRAGEHDLKVAEVEIEVSWTLISALMSLGPNFVRPHLSQLLVLWRNALPKPTNKDTANNAVRSVADWLFLLHVRECALGAILSFLQFNASTLVTLDVARRVASVLSNALSFANNFISQNVEDPADSQPPVIPRKGLSMRDREALLRRRVYQCFSALGFSSIAESTQMTLLQSAVSLFASPEGYTGSSVQAAIASSSGSFTTVWNSTDGYAYGVTSHDIVDYGGIGVDGESSSTNQDYLNRDSIEASLETLLRTPIFGACEHDTLSLCQSVITETDYRLVEPPPGATSVVDSAIDLFSRLLPLQDLSSSIKIINQLLESVRSPRLEKNAGRKSAVFINAAVAIVLALRVATTSHARQGRETFGNGQVTSLLSPFLMEAIIDGDLILRSAGSESMGRLASLSGTNYLTSQIKDLVDKVVSNRNPYGRAGCALAFGSIYTHVGGLAAGALLKTTINVLMSLSNDPHPVVHFWALNALTRVINAASLAYAPYVTGTLGLLLKLYLMESHEKEGGTLGNSNISGDCPAYPVMCQIIDAIINVLGPDIQESPRVRTLILNLVHEFSREEDDGIRVESIKCIQHFLMFAPEHVDTPDLVKRFRKYLSSGRRPLKLASINALYQLVQKDALAMSKLGGDRLVEDLFAMLDDDSSVEGVRNVITSWLQQTVIYNPGAWIDLCQRIMSRTNASQQTADAAVGQGLRDDEGESLNVGNASASRGHATSRWRTQLFALQCLHTICTIVSNSGRKEHVNAIYARSQGVPTQGLLYNRVADLIKMAFTASAAYVTEIRLEGLMVLRDVIEVFASSPDPAYDDALLLEQHQAPITAALTPAFSSDSTPEILASAVHACAVFVGCGVVKDVSRMGRILKLLTSALEQSKESGMLSLGETGEMSPNASAMLRICTLSAWAQLQVSSTQQSYLQKVVQPYRPVLASLWIASLRDYASIRVDSEFLHDSTSIALDSSHSSLGKEVLLPYYRETWATILQAVATSMQTNDPHIVAAMDGRELGPNEKPLVSQGPKQEPSAFFFILFGLVYEALSTSSSDSSGSSQRQSDYIAALQALKCLVKPEYAGKAILEPTIFDEFTSLLYRIAMTEPADIQVHLIEALSIFASTQSDSSDEDPLSLTSPRSHCLRICSQILRNSTTASRSGIIRGSPSDKVALVSAAISAFSTIATGLETSVREDVRGVGILLYCDLLKDESPEIDLVGPTLPAFKTLLDLPPAPGPGNKETYSQLMHALLSTCLRHVDEMSNRQGPGASKKIKNNLLAAVLLLTVIPQDVKLGRQVIEHCCLLISQKLVDGDETSLTAAHCAKTLIMAASAGNPTLRQCVKLLIPGLVQYIAKMAPHVHEGTLTDVHLAGIGEIWKAFAAFFAATAEDHKSRVLGVLLPTIALLLLNSPPSQGPIASLSSQTVKQLLAFATASPAGFKDAAAKLDPPVRELLEQSIRRAVGGTAGATTQAAAKPQISLRSF